MAIAVQQTPQSIHLDSNISFEKYQKIITYINDLGVKIKNHNQHDLTDEDLKIIEISNQQIKEGKVVDNDVVLQKLKNRYEN